MTHILNSCIWNAVVGFVTRTGDVSLQSSVLQGTKEDLQILVPNEIIKNGPRQRFMEAVQYYILKQYIIGLHHCADQSQSGSATADQSQSKSVTVNQSQSRSVTERTNHRADLPLRTSHRADVSLRTSC